MAKIAGTCFFKVDGQQLSLTGGIEVPMNTNVRDDVVADSGGFCHQIAEKSAPLVAH